MPLARSSGHLFLNYKLPMFRHEALDFDHVAVLDAKAGIRPPFSHREAFKLVAH